ncbi:MAG: hypothetical protein ABEH43_09320, partial [Flavobacteriales bacterium]
TKDLNVDMIEKLEIQVLHPYLFAEKRGQVFCYFLQGYIEKVIKYLLSKEVNASIDAIKQQKCILNVSVDD